MLKELLITIFVLDVLGGSPVAKPPPVYGELIIYSRNVEGVRWNVNNRQIADQYKHADVVLLQEVFDCFGTRSEVLAEDFGHSCSLKHDWNPLGSGLLNISNDPINSKREWFFSTPAMDRDWETIKYFL